MTYVGNEPRLTKDNLREKSVTHRRRAIVWILVAFGFLIAGLAGGTILFAWKREWAWVFSVASFGGYLLAFRRGLLMWSPSVDRTWRHCLWLDREVITEDEEISYVAGEDVVSSRKRPARPELSVLR